MAGIERVIPGAQSSRSGLQNRSIDTGTKVDRSKRLEQRCKHGNALCPDPRNERPSHREMYGTTDMKRASYGSGFCLLERLVSPELYQREPEWINLNLVVLHDRAENIGDAGCPTLALELGMVCRIREDFHKLNSRRIR